LPVESYLESGNRDDFDQGGVMTLHPVFAASNGVPCAPIIRQGAVLQEIRVRLAARAERRRSRAG
jgi:hypothetical protein